MPCLGQKENNIIVIRNWELTPESTCVIKPEAPSYSLAQDGLYSSFYLSVFELHIQMESLTCSWMWGSHYIIKFDFLLLICLTSI